MLFITAGMGGGTGTGAAPVIARIAKEIDLEDEEVNKILVVAIVTLPFHFEGRKRKQLADKGIEELRKYADAVLIISNDKLRETYGNLGLLEAFKIADNVLLTAAKGIAEIITEKAYVNIDFKDVNTVMRDSGVAIMGTGIAEGENRANKAIKDAISSPLLNDNDIKGTDNILLYLSSGNKDISFDEITEITDYILDAAGTQVDIIWGAGQNESLGDNISVTIVATGFDKEVQAEPAKKVRVLYEDSPKPTNGMKEVTPPRPTRPAAEPELDTEEDEELNEIKLVSKSVDDIINDSSLTEVSEEAQSSVTETSEADKPSFNEASEDKPKIIRFTLDDPAPEPETKESVTEIGELTNKTIEQDDDDQTFREQKPKFKPTEKQETLPGAPEDRESADKKHKERVEKLRQMSIKLKSPGGLNELENEPAYRRKNVDLSEEKPSEESQVSRYTLSDEDDEAKLKDNTFLHDNVD
jgi:cell division protein FtsZ